MGQWLGISEFDNYEELMRLNREMNRATRADTKALREAGAEGLVLRGMLIGGTNTSTPTLKVPKVVDEWMGVFRGRFAFHVILGLGGPSTKCEGQSLLSSKGGRTSKKAAEGPLS